MKFNEKLMELRKKEGLSQEELGYKLNVTRQTVSKWELGQTTPEMDKLVEMSKIFGITVDDLINESEIENNTNIAQESIIEDRPIENKGGKKDKVGIILVGAFVVVIILIIVKLFTGFGSLNKNINDGENIFERFFGMFDRIFSMQEEMMNNAENTINNVNDMQNDIMDYAQNMIGDVNSQMNTASFNGTLELYKGSNSGTFVKRLLDEVITSNKKEERKVTIKYGETETADPEEIKTLKMNINENYNFEISFEYDEEGFINKALLERVYTEFEINSFNSTIEMRTGTKMGNLARSVLDDVITSNKTEERKITVKYGNTETQDEAEIRKIKQGFDIFADYEVYVEYDEVGFINKVIIEKL